MFSRKQFNSERERFRLFDLRSNLTNSFSIRSRKSIRLALIGGFIASFFLSLRRKCTTFFSTHVRSIIPSNFPFVKWKLENFFHAMNRDERRTFARSWNYSSLYPPTRLKREQKRNKIRGRILGSNSPFFSTARYFNALIAAVRLSPPSPRGRGEVSTRFEARRYREISRLVVTRPGNELLVIVVVERKGGPVLLVENWLPSGGVKNHRTA